MTSTELAQVTARYFAEGETLSEIDLDGYAFDFWWNKLTPAGNLPISQFTTDADPTVFLCDTVGFNVRAVPSGIGDHTGFIQCELDNMGVADTFDPDEYAPLFKSIADKLRSGISDPVEAADPVVSFVAVFTCWADRDYWGEYDSSMDYVGYLVLADGSVTIASI